MDARTIAYLNELNQAFYKQIVENFDESRGRAWAGWARILPYVSGITPLRVLDAGCGNGRLGRFLSRHLSTPIHYHGIDYIEELLTAAREAFAARGILPDARLEVCDILTNPPGSGVYDVVALMGVLHHIPGGESRAALLSALAERVSVGGVFVFTAWCFYDYPRFRERLLPIPTGYATETGDFLMDWRRGHAAQTALRYCHHVDETEYAALIARSTAQGLTAVATFRADGHTEDSNRYAILQRLR
ncbi:MAG TPA: class I SAM-dependent methyltransferase [Aggregatilineales bacterium]|nr:class I SAM-dependent methyltransferase [Anaerolineales bacterium]HRE46982.1 class I SAM-dependent methyltransferase [Aggregatilineales bacterium]